VKFFKINKPHGLQSVNRNKFHFQDYNHVYIYIYIGIADKKVLHDVNSDFDQCCRWLFQKPKHVESYQNNKKLICY
jgi:hypothetical protein